MLTTVWWRDHDSFYQVVAVDLWQQGVIELLMAQQMEMEGSP